MAANDSTMVMLKCTGDLRPDTPCAIIRLINAWSIQFHVHQKLKAMYDIQSRMICKGIHHLLSSAHEYPAYGLSVSMADWTLHILQFHPTIKTVPVILSIFVSILYIAHWFVVNTSTFAISWLYSLPTPGLHNSSSYMIRHGNRMFWHIIEVQTHRRCWILWRMLVCNLNKLTMTRCNSLSDILYLPKYSSTHIRPTKQPQMHSPHIHIVMYIIFDILPIIFCFTINKLKAHSWSSFKTHHIQGLGAHPDWPLL